MKSVPTYPMPDKTPCELFDIITEASYRGFEFRELLRNDLSAYAAAVVLAERLQQAATILAAVR